MDSAKNVMWIIPFKKFDMVRVKVSMANIISLWRFTSSYDVKDIPRSCSLVRRLEPLLSLFIVISLTLGSSEYDRICPEDKNNRNICTCKVDKIKLYICSLFNYYEFSFSFTIVNNT